MLNGKPTETNRGSEGKEKLLVVQSFIFAQNDLINSNLNADSPSFLLKKVENGKWY